MKVHISFTMLAKVFPASIVDMILKYSAFRYVVCEGSCSLDCDLVSKYPYRCLENHSHHVPYFLNKEGNFVPPPILQIPYYNIGLCNKCRYENALLTNYLGEYEPDSDPMEWEPTSDVDIF